MPYFSPSQRPRSIMRHRALQNGYAGHSTGGPGIAFSQIGHRTFVIARESLICLSCPPSLRGFSRCHRLRPACPLVCRPVSQPASMRPSRS